MGVEYNVIYISIIVFSLEFLSNEKSDNKILVSFEIMDYLYNGIFCF